MANGVTNPNGPLNKFLSQAEENILNEGIQRVNQVVEYARQNPQHLKDCYNLLSDFGEQLKVLFKHNIDNVVDQMIQQLQSTHLSESKSTNEK